MKSQKEDGFDLTLEENQYMHKTARNIDHLLVLFQCDLCHFRNLKQRDPEQGKGDAFLLRTIRRANLDSF